MPLSYRVSIEIRSGEFTLKREYFYVGFNDGESEDNFYFDNEVSWANIIGITPA